MKRNDVVHSKDISITAPIEKLVPYSLWEFLRYFLWLGTFGFGGPIALAGYMQRDLVDRKRWVSKDDYIHGLALAQLCPGPLAAQLAMYLGWVRAGVLGASLVAAAFILPSLVMVLIISALYVHFGSLPWMEGAFYGIGAAVIALIIRSAIKLAKMTNGKDILLWVVFTINALVTAWTASEILWIFVLSGIAIMLIKAPPMMKINSSLPLLVPAPWLMSGIHGVASTGTLLKIVLYFAWAGTFVFGSGLAIVPFLHGGVVDQYHWLTERQFLDAVAVTMITPGPVVITVAFIGYLVGGLAGAILAAIGVFIPCYLFVVILAPHYRRLVGNLSIKAFVSGVTAAAAGAIAGASFVLGKQAIIDFKTASIFLISFILLVTTKKIPEPLLIVAAGLVGFCIKSIA
ncbi:chromate transporter [Fluoribacter dumoffii]|uniref:Chromate transporter, chromate ion transporter (CHR) family n=1 Tax=Fluoribacter dumoffii TaxID=463 RepID=A0A377ITM7_9GAMM|nr:chromate transporter [Fluoribacter dumoffii]KTC89167.1 chromate transporter [Fluoribacter dumoffii NY 23]STO91561.1 chromate transporter, chromate ion transporter (CHR) family [Fluoribacter dumoffii]